MANIRSNEQGQPTQGENAPRTSSQRSLARSSSYPAGFISPGEFFRMNPFSLMRRMSEEMDRMFGDVGKTGDGGRQGWSPAISVAERDGKYVVRAEVPGVDSKDIKLEVTEDAIVLEGERREEREENRGGVQFNEHRYGSFYRAIPLPEGTKVEEANAKCENGVLEITVPVAREQGKRRQIPIQSANASSQGTSAQGTTGKSAGSEKAA
jgi:HSP20 family protein